MKSCFCAIAIAMKALGKMFAILPFALVLPVACGKQPNPPAVEEKVEEKAPSESFYSTQPLSFAVPEVAEQQTKAQTNTAVGPAYNTAESFKVFAAYSAAKPFTPAEPSSYTNYWDASGLTCSYNSYYRGWVPATTYYWPRTGYLNFWAYSPADGFAPTFSWTDGFTYNSFENPGAGLQYDLLYSDRVTDCQRSDYTITDGGSYDDDPDLVYIYKGVNLYFHHALSLVEVQAISSLGSYSVIKFYIQSVKLKNIYKIGTFTSRDGVWAVNTGVKTDYTLLDLSGELNPEEQWQQLPGSDEAPRPIHPNVTLMPLPQELDRSSEPAFSESVDAYLEVVYKSSSDNIPHTALLPLTVDWERGRKYTYKLVFSADIEFTANITGWDADITYGSYLIVQ